LDAGTGLDSLTWLAASPATSITAVTASKTMHKDVVGGVADFLDPSADIVLIGNWQDEQLLHGRSFDVVIADYLLGAVDYFAPHFQDGLLRRLAGLVRPDGWLAIVGREPDDITAKDATSQLILDANALRDASMTLSRQMTYREIPQWWVQERLGALGLQVREAKLFPRQVTKDKVLGRLVWAEKEIRNVPHGSLRASLLKHLAGLRARVQASRALARGHPFGQDYAMLVQQSPPQQGARHGLSSV